MNYSQMSKSKILEKLFGTFLHHAVRKFLYFFLLCNIPKVKKEQKRISISQLFFIWCYTVKSIHLPMHGPYNKRAGDYYCRAETGIYVF